MNFIKSLIMFLFIYLTILFCINKRTANNFFEYVIAD